jgi:hypothetical protein
MNAAEMSLVVAILLLPPALGVAAAVARKPWWWAAAAAVVLAMAAAIVPTPEPGESRLAVGDIPFLLVLAAWVTGLAVLGFTLTRRLRVERPGSRSTPAA